MPLVESLILPGKAAIPPEPAVSAGIGSSSSSNPVFRGMAYAFFFEVMFAVSCYMVWHSFTILRHH
jgi:hypothetical protein